MNSNKTILVTFPFGIVARNMICSRTIEALRAKGFRVVIITPTESHKLLREFYRDENIILEDYPKYKTFFKGGVNRDANWFEKLLMGLINAPLDTGAIKYRRKEQWVRKKYFTYFRRLFFQSIFAGHYGLSEFFRKLDAKYFPDKLFKELFEKYKPCAVFSPHAQFDSNLIKRARAEGVPSFGQILSWDNLTSKGNIRSKSDYLFVWNDIMKKEAVKYDTYSPERVIPIGIPQYDIYFDKTILENREEFCKKIGADPNKPLIVYASEARESPDDKETIELLINSQKENKFVKDFTILARTHPRDISGPFNKFKDNPNVIVNDPHVNEIDPFIDHWQPSKEEIKYLINLMYHSAIVIMIGSTIGFDALGFNRSVISMGFELNEKPYWFRVQTYYKYFPHHKPWIESGAFEVPTSKDELINAINKYLKDPTEDDDKRKNLRNKIFYKFDGKTGERIAEFIYEKTISKA